MIAIVFDGPPGPEAGRFVEVEQDGRSIKFGEWEEQADGYWNLNLVELVPLETLRVQLAEAEAEVERRKGKHVFR